MSKTLCGVSGLGSSGNAAVGDVLSGKTFSNDSGVGLTGTMTDKGSTSSSATVDADTDNSRIRMQVPANGYYNTSSYLYAAYSSFGNAAVDNVLTGKTFTSSAGFKATGTMANKSGSSSSLAQFSATVDADTDNSRVRMKIPAAGYYNTYSYLYAAYSTFGNATAAQVLNARTFTSSAGFKATGTMANKSGSSSSLAQFSATVDADTDNSRVRMKVPAAGYYNTYSYLYAAYSSFGNATAAQVLSGRTFTSSAGFKATGTITSQAAKTVYATTSNQTAVESGKYCSGAITVSKLTQTNLAAGNILRGKTISVNNGNANVWSVAGNNAVLKVISGSVSSFTNTKSVSWTTGTMSLKYGNVNPGITPIYAVYVSGSTVIFRKGQSSANGGSGYYDCGGSTSTNMGDWSSTSVSVFGEGNNTGYYWIFGY